MPRRGWSKADVPTGWIQIVRSEQWPRADSVRSPVLQRSATFKSAKDKVSRRSQGGSTEQDPQAGEGLRGVERFFRPVGRCPQVRVGGEASSPPLKVQITSTQDFIRRSKRRVAELEAERIAESKLFEEARERLHHLEAARSAEESAVPSPSATRGSRKTSFLARVVRFCVSFAPQQDVVVECHALFVVAPQLQRRASVNSQSIAWDITMFRGQHAQPVNPSTSLPRGSPCRRFPEGHQVAGSTDKLGPNDHAERSSLEASLRKAQQQATFPLVAEQAEQTAQKNREGHETVTSAEEWVQWAQDWRSESAKGIAFGKDPCRAAGKQKS